MRVIIEGKPAELAEGATAADSAKSEALAARINGQPRDLSTVLQAGDDVEYIDFKSRQGREIFWHSAAHVLAHAVKSLYPDTKLAIGPATDDGFYYDFDREEPFTPEDLKKIEGEMKKIVRQNLAFERSDANKTEALRLAKEEPYKTELINELAEDTVTVYKQGEFVDICRGPHVPSTGLIRAFRLTKVAGAYWRGLSQNRQLQRIYGVAVPTKDELKSYLTMLEQAMQRDHRKLGKQLRLFSFHDEGPGFPFWHPKGMFIFNRLVQFWREEHEKAGYVETKTPIILHRKLWEQSGHWDNYKESMYYTKIDSEDYAVKPMNCPGGMLMYLETVHSYRELPMRVGEIGLVHRHELSGVLSGLFRVRMFHQDDAHIFMTESQIKDEILGVLNLAKRFYSKFGLGYHLELSTRPEKSVGTDEQWETATKGLKDALDSTGEGYKINEGDGAFYGPKIDLHIKDALGRTWQCGTIQLDMALPERFKLTYMGEDGRNVHRPVMIHRVIYGSLERFIGILIEHYAGRFPLWLSPEQVRILSVAERFGDYARKVADSYREKGIRATVDNRSESVSKKVREAQLEKVNYILVVGEKELAEQSVTVRTENKVIGMVKSAEFLKSLLEQI